VISLPVFQPGQDGEVGVVQGGERVEHGNVVYLGVVVDRLTERWHDWAPIDYVQKAYGTQWRLAPGLPLSRIKMICIRGVLSDTTR
jgi:hypothetical protein